MRKVLSFVLVLSLVLGSFSMAFAATPATGFSDMNGEASAEAVSVLSDLGVVSGYPDGEYKPENIVTRAEMSVFVIGALGLTDYVTTSAKSSFPDMAGYGWAEGYIAYAESLGILSGYPDGTFKPGNTVTYDEVASMLVRALGYSAESLPGSWPANFVVKAKSLGILDGVQAGAAGANRGDVAIMLYQTLDQPIGSINKDGEWVSNNKTGLVANDDTMLSRLGAEAKDAKVLTNSNTANAKINVKPYIGAFAVTYEKDDKIIAVGEVKSTFLTGDYDASASELKVGDVTYNNVTATALTGPAYFLNGGDATSGTVTTTGLTVDGDNVTLAVKLSGKKVDAIYSVSEWNGVTFVANSSTAKVIADDKTMNSADFALDDDKEIDLDAFELLGVDKLDKIAKDNIVTYYVGNINGDNVITKIKVGTETVTGKVTKFATVKGDPQYTIDGKAYVKVGNLAAPAVGDTGTAYLNYEGEIYKWSKTDGASGNYAVAVDDVRIIGSYTTNAAVELYTKDGVKKLFDIDTTIATGNAMTGKIVEFDTNKDGEITTVNAVSVTASSVLTERGTFAGQLVDDKAVVFVKSGSKYSIGSVADIDKDRTIELAYTTGSAGKIEAIIVNSDDAGAKSTYGFITQVADGLNADGDAAKLVTALVDGKTVEYVANSNTDTYTHVKDKLVKFEFDGDEVKSATTVSAVAVSPTYTANQVGAYNTTFAAATVSGIDAGRIQMPLGYQVVDEDALVLVATFKSDNTFDKYAVSSLEAINEGYHAVLIQLDKDSEIYDLVIYVKTADIGKSLPALN
jgi:hypothetical protein